MAVEKATFTLPEELLRRLEKVPAGKRSLLVAEALKRELDRRTMAKALKKLRRRTAWKEKDHPMLRLGQDLVRFPD
jgi:metal-responsive CopG/Arc/MetJ family transcriptional regulator